MFSQIRKGFIESWSVFEITWPMAARQVALRGSLIPTAPETDSWGIPPKLET